MAKKVTSPITCWLVDSYVWGFSDRPWKSRSKKPLSILSICWKSNRSLIMFPSDRHSQDVKGGYLPCVIAKMAKSSNHASDLCWSRLEKGWQRVNALIWTGHPLISDIKKMNDEGGEVARRIQEEFVALGCGSTTIQHPNKTFILIRLLKILLIPLSWVKRRTKNRQTRCA